MRNLAAIDELLDVVTKTYVDGEISSHNHDHGGLTGLGDDDHTQYLNSTRHAALFDSTLPVALTPDIAGAAGATTVPARRDHVHNVPAATAVGVSNATANAEGSSGSFARADHTHAVTGFALTSHNHAASNITSGTLAVARGGTGIASYTTGNYINASGATTLQQRTPAQVLADIGASASSHTHDTRYYTESEIDTFLAGKSDTSHGHSFSDHGALTGLGDDDHTQYFNSTRHDAHDHSAVLDSAVIDDLSNVVVTSVANDEVLAWNGSAWVNQTAAEAGLATPADVGAMAFLLGGM